MSLRYALLGLISKKEQTGYEIHKSFKEQMSYFWNSNHSQIYTELNKMEDKGLISSKLIFQVGSPNKKIYRLTDVGKEELTNWLVNEECKPVKIKDEFLIKASVFEMLPNEEVLKLLDRVMEREKNILAGTVEWQAKSSKDLGEYATSEFGIMYAKMYINWCKKIKEKILSSNN